MVSTEHGGNSGTQQFGPIICQDFRRSILIIRIWILFVVNLHPFEYCQLLPASQSPQRTFEKLPEKVCCVLKRVNGILIGVCRPHMILGEDDQTRISKGPLLSDFFYKAHRRLSGPGKLGWPSGSKYFTRILSGGPIYLLVDLLHLL